MRISYFCDKCVVLARNCNSATLLFFGMLLKSEEHDQCHELSLYFMYYQAEAYFNLIYRRYLKQKVGWKRAMEVQLNQRCLIEKLQKVHYYY